MIQDHEGRARREVGCQWESLESERREVGCQSNIAERGDAAVQVDFTWSYSGASPVPWQCVCVPADDPGESALLFHTATQVSYNQPPLYLLPSPYSYPPLPTMPLFRPPAPLHLQDQLQSKEVHLPGLLPSMPMWEPPLPQEPRPTLCSAPLLSMPVFRMSPTDTLLSPCPPPPYSMTTPTDYLAPPPGLIAPLSPHLAAENEEDKGSLNHNNIECLCSDKHVTMTPMKKRRCCSCNTSRQKPREVLKQINHNVRKNKAEMPGGRSEKRPPAAGIQHTTAEDRKVAGVREEAGRPRRKAVGPPIRYLLEFEVANHSRATAKRKPRWQGEEDSHRERGGVQLTEETDGGVDGVWWLCQVCGLKFTREVSLERHLSVHRHRRGNGASREGERSKEEVQEEEPLPPAPTKAPDWLRQHVTRNPQWTNQIVKRRLSRPQEEDGGGMCGEVEKEVKGGGKEEELMEVRRVEEQVRGGDDGGEKKVRNEVTEQPQRPRRMMVGPPIRYLLESEKQSCLGMAHQDRARGFRWGRKPQKKITSKGRVTAHTTVRDRLGEVERQTGQTNQDAVNEPGQKRARPKKIVTHREAGGSALQRHPGHIFGGKKTGHIVTEGQTGHMVVEEQTEEQRGRMILDRQAGLMITETQNGHMIEEGQTDHMDSGGPSTNQDAVNKSKQKTGSPQKAVIGSETCGGASQMQKNCMVSDRQTTPVCNMWTYLAYRDLQSGQVTLILPCCVRLQRLL